MATFIKDKSSAFKQTGDKTELPTKQRSEARMKAYTSATDARAWVNNMTESKQYIIDLIGTELPKHHQLGKYVPVDVLIKTLMNNKDADIKRLNTIIHEMEVFINGLDLNSEEMRKYKNMKATWGAGDAISQLKKSNIPVSDSRYSRTLSESRAQKHTRISDPSRTSSESRLTSPRADATSSQQPRTAVRTHYGQVDPKSGRLPHKRPMSYRSSNEDDEYDSSRSTPVPSKRSMPCQIESNHKNVQAGSSIATKDSETQANVRQFDVAHKDQQANIERIKPVCASKSVCAVKCRIPVPVQSHDSKSTKKSKGTDANDDFDDLGSTKSMPPCGDCEANKKIARQAIEQLETLKGILNERYSVENDADPMKARVDDKNSCNAEISAIAQEVERLRSSENADQLKVVTTELKLLKKYCQKLMYIREENKNLLQENEKLKSRKQGSSLNMKTYHSSVISVDGGPSDKPELERKLLTKITALKDMTRQRDKLQSSVTKLELKLRKYDNLNNEIRQFKEKSKVLDCVMEEKLNLERRLEKVAHLEKTMTALKQRADKADELQRALENAQNKLLQMTEHPTKQMHAQSGTTGDDASISQLRIKAREAEVLRVERDRLRVRLEELAHVEQEFTILQNKCRCLEAVRAERDMYKTKSYELENIKDEYDNLQHQADRVHSLSEERETMLRKLGDYECVIADQENEISRLVLHIDRLSKGQDKHQDKAKQIITGLRTEIEKKSSLIVTSEIQLQSVQSQLKQTIDKLSSETSMLKQQVTHGDSTCNELKLQVDQLTSQLEEAHQALETKTESVSACKQKIADLTAENARLHEIADQMNDLTDAAKLDSILKKSHEALQTAAEKLSSFGASPRRDSTDSATNTKPRSAKRDSSGIPKRSSPSQTDKRSPRESTHSVPSVLEANVIYSTSPVKPSKLPATTATVMEIVLDGRGLPNQVSSEFLDRGSSYCAMECPTCMNPAGSATLLPSAVSEVEKPSDEDVAAVQYDPQPQQTLRTQDDTQGEKGDKACMDTSETGRKMQELQEQGKVNLDGIACVCKGVQHPICKCKDAGTDTNLDDEEITKSKYDGNLQNALVKQESKLLELKKQRDSVIMENQALRKHASELKDVAKSQISSLSAELRKSREEYAKTDDSKMKKLQDELAQGQGKPDALGLGQLASAGADPTKKGDTDCQSELDELRRQLAKCKEELAARPAGGDLAVSKDAPVKDTDAIHQQNELLGKQLQQCTDELEELRRQLQKCREDLNQQKQLAELQRPSALTAPITAEAGKIKDGTDDLEDELRKLREQLAAANKRLQDCQDVLEAERAKFQEERKNLLGSGAAGPSGIAGPGIAGPGIAGPGTGGPMIAGPVTSGPGAAGAGTADQGAAGQGVAGPGAAGQGAADKGTAGQGSVGPAVATAGPDAAGGGGANQSELDELRKLLAKCQEELENERKKAGGDNQAELDELRKLLAKCQEELAIEKNKPRGDAQDEKSKALDAQQVGGGISQNDYENMLKQLEAERLKNQTLQDAVESGDSAGLLDEYKRRIAELEAQLKDCLEKNAHLQRSSEESGSKLKLTEKQLSKTKRQSMKAIQDARKSYERDLNELQEKYSEGIEKLQASHEEIISQSNKDLEAEIESLRHDSIEKQQTIDDLRCLCYDTKKPKQKPKPKPPLCQVQVPPMDIEPNVVCSDMLFVHLLKKILYCGIQSLSFEDLQYMHTKICEATAKVMGKRNDCTCTYESSDMKQRQNHAQTQVAKLQMEVALERQRLESLKKALEIERCTQQSMTQYYERQAKQCYAPRCCPPAPTCRTQSIKTDSVSDYFRSSSAIELNPMRKKCREHCRNHISATSIKHAA